MERRDNAQGGDNAQVRKGGTAPSRSRHTRFEPVTIRAAARVLSLARSGAIHPWEENAYLQDLLGLDRFARGRDWEALRRLARWRSRLGDAGAPRGMKTRQRTPAVAA